MIDSNEAAEPDHRTVNELPPRLPQVAFEPVGDVKKVNVTPPEGREPTNRSISARSSSRTRRFTSAMGREFWFGR